MITSCVDSVVYSLNCNNTIKFDEESEADFYNNQSESELYKVE